MPINHVSEPRRTVASALLYEYFSIKKLIAGSIREIEDVIAAKKSKTKNRVATNSPYGMTPNAKGNVWKINPGPADDGSRLNVKTIGKIIIPANIATKVSDNATTVVTSVIDDSFDKYDPYIISDPIPILNEKKAIPMALRITSAFIFSRSGINIYLTPS